MTPGGADVGDRGRYLGRRAGKAEKPGELRDAVDQALKADGPAIVDCMVAADEMPNIPHLELEEAGNYAKIKEAILEVTGG